MTEKSVPDMNYFEIHLEGRNLNILKFDVYKDIITDTIRISMLDILGELRSTIEDIIGSRVIIENLKKSYKNPERFKLIDMYRCKFETNITISTEMVQKIKEEIKNKLNEKLNNK